MLSVVVSPIATTIAHQVTAHPVCYAAYQALDDYTGTYEDVDFVSYQAAIKSKSKKGHNPDFPSFYEAMSSADYEQWQQAMDKEIETLKKFKTWTILTRSSVTEKGRKVLPTI